MQRRQSPACKIRRSKYDPSDDQCRFLLATWQGDSEPPVGRYLSAKGLLSISPGGREMALGAWHADPPGRSSVGPDEKQPRSSETHKQSQYDSLADRRLLSGVRRLRRRQIARFIH